MRRTYRGTVAFMLAVLTAAPAALADEGTINYRKSYMSAIGGHLGAARALAIGEFDAPEHLLRHARTLAELTADILLLFPEGSGAGETSAKAEIWENPADFEQKADDAKAAADDFLAAVTAGESSAIGAAFKELGLACRACHKAYKASD